MNLLQAMEDGQLFAPWFRGDAWDAWKIFLATLFGLSLKNGLTEKGDALVQEHTGRKTTPSEAFSEAWMAIGRRGGKSLIAALVAVYLACFRNYGKHLAPGEIATVMINRNYVVLVAFWTARLSLSAHENCGTRNSTILT